MIGRVIGLAAAAMSSAAYAESVPKQPTGKWVVNFADAQCIATRNYGSEDDPLYLLLKAPPAGSVLQIGIIRKGSPTSASQAEGEIVFGDAAPFRTTLLEYGGVGTGQRALVTNVPTRELGSLSGATSLRIKARGTGFKTVGSHVPLGRSGSFNESFAITHIPELLKVLDDCAADLRSVWHVWDDKTGSPHLKQGPRGNVTRLFEPEDYPAVAFLDDQMGTVGLVLLVDEKGEVADCTVTETSGAASLDAQSCGVIKQRGKFTPALGLDGKPSKSSWFQRITWRLEG